MRSLYALSRNNKSPFGNRTEVNIPKNIIPKKKISIFAPDKTTYYNPPQKNLDKRLFPYRSFNGFSSNCNHINQPNENEKNVYYHHVETNRLKPLVTRQDLLKYLRQSGKLIKRKRYCISCERIKEENSKNNFSTIEQNNLPVITGRSFGNKFKIIHRYKTPSNSRNQASNLKYKCIDCNNEDKSKMIKILKSSCDIPSIEEEKNGRYDNCDKLNEVTKDNNEKLKLVSVNNTKRVFYVPKKRTNFHKIQIFNHYKPYLVDEFKDFGDYY